MKRILVLLLFWSFQGLAGVDHGNPSRFINPVFGYQISFDSAKYKIDSERLDFVKINSVDSENVLSIKSHSTEISEVEKISNEINVNGCTATKLNGLAGYRCTNRYVLLAPSKALFELTFGQETPVQDVVGSFQLSKRDVIAPEMRRISERIGKLIPIPHSNLYLAEPTFYSGSESEWIVYDSAWNVKTRIASSYRFEDIDAHGTKLLLGNGGDLRIYDIRSGELTFSYENKNLRLDHARFAPNDLSFIATPYYAEDNKQALFEIEIETKKVVRSLAFPDQERRMNIVKDGKGNFFFFRNTRESTKTYVWNYHSGEFVWSPPTQSVWSPGFTPDGRLILSYELESSAENRGSARIELWRIGASIPDHRIYTEDHLSEFYFTSKVFATHGKFGNRSFVRIWDFKTWKQLPAYFESSEELKSIAFSTDGTELVGVKELNSKSKIALWKLEDKSQLNRIDFDDEVNQVLVPKAGNIFYAFSGQCIISTLDRKSKAILSSFRLQECSKYVELSKDDRRLYARSDNSFSIYDLKTQTLLKSMIFKDYIDPITRITMLPDESAIIYVSRTSNALVKLKFGSGETLVWKSFDFDVSTEFVSSRLSPDGRTAIIPVGMLNSGIEKTVVFDLAQFKILSVVDIAGGLFAGPNLLIGSKDYGKKIVLTNWETGQAVWEFDPRIAKDSEERDEYIVRTLISEDHKTLFVQTSVYVDVFDLQSHIHRKRLVAHMQPADRYKGRIIDMKPLSPTELVTTGFDGTIRVWNIGN